MCQNMVQERSRVRGFKTPRNQDKSLATWFSSKTQKLFLDSAFMLLLGVADKSEFTSHYSLQLDIVVCLHALTEKYVPALCSLPATCGLPL